MATYYVGTSAAGTADGSSWENRYGSLNAAEDTPVVAGDTVYVGPGVYRELLTVDVSGGAGNPITYIGDVTGESTDGLGGIVRITGSDNDQTPVRNFAIFAAAKHYRTFRGFFLDTTVFYVIASITSPTNWIVEDCILQNGTLFMVVWFEGNAQANCTVRRCVFMLGGHYYIYYSAVGINNAGHLVENCAFFNHASALGYGVFSQDVGGITVRNCLFSGIPVGVFVSALTGGAHVAPVVNNCLFHGTNLALWAAVLGDLTEDFNSFYANTVDRTNVNVGGNSQTYPPLQLPPLLYAGVSQLSGFKFPWWFGELSEWSAVRAITGTNEPTEDLRGIVRPVTASKNSWGAIQFYNMERETGTVRAGVASLALHDAGVHQMFVPVKSESTEISVWVYREANYAGGNPRMTVKQPGQADDITIDGGVADTWNRLRTTLTPAAAPPYVVVELASFNAAGAGNFSVFWDNLAVG